MNRTIRNGLVSLGSSFYWTECLLQLGGFSGLNHFVNFSTAWVSTLFCFFSVSFVFLIFRKTLSQKALTALTVAATAFSLCSCALMSICYLNSAANSTYFVVLSNMTQGIGAGILMQVWSLRFAMTGIRDSIGVVGTTVFLSAGMFLFIVALPAFLIAILYCLLLAFSALCSLLIKDKGFGVVLSTRTARPAQWRAFWSTRLLYGLGIGFIISMAQAKGFLTVISPLTQGLCGVFGAILLVFIAIFSLSQKTLPIAAYLLPCLPLAIIASFFLLLAGSSLNILIPIAIASSWLCFIVLTSVQISNYRMIFGMRDTLIAFSEKAVIFTAWTLSMLLGTLAENWLTHLSIPIEAIVGIFTGIIIVGTVLALSRYAQTLSAMDYFKESSAGLRSMILERCHNLAALHGLTPREEEIIGFLAMGRSGPYIANELVISEGTFKTHCYRIYQKLGIHKNQELLDMVIGGEQTNQEETPLPIP
ncbi:MAG: helix-turn-helix transcriptional regulator [Coriobacteriales bacterium]|nr:helix-turn-helix transcriptional regulator [Coriobacteriales bacterium]